MIRRWRTLLRPETVEQLPHPTAAEAAATWMLGTAFALDALWVATQGRGARVPLLLAGGLLAMWGWRRRGWIFWFPTAAVLAAVADGWAAGAGAGRPGAACADLLVTGTVLVACARSIRQGRVTRRRRPAPERLLAVALVLSAALAALDPRAEASPALRQIPLCAAALLAAMAAARRPQVVERAWLAFPLAAVALGALELVATGRAAVLDAVRGAPDGGGTPADLPVALACTLPLTWAMALGRGGARPLPMLGAVLGTAGLALGIARLRDLPGGPLAPPDPVALALVGAMVVTGPRLLRLALAAPGPVGSRRAALAATFVVGLAALAAAGQPTRPVALLLLAVAAGLGIGLSRGARRPAAVAAAPGAVEPLRRAA